MYLVVATINQFPWSLLQHRRSLLLQICVVTTHCNTNWLLVPVGL